MAGRQWKTAYAGGATRSRYYNTLGQLEREVDPDGVQTLYAYSPTGDPEVTCIDMDRNGSIDYGGTDRIAKTFRSVTSRNGITVNRTVTQQWDDSGPVTISQNDTDSGGLSSWSTTDFGNRPTPATAPPRPPITTTMRSTPSPRLSPASRLPIPTTRGDDWTS